MGPDALTTESRPFFDVSDALPNDGSNHALAVLYIDGQRAGQDESDGGGQAGIQPDAAIGEGAHTAYVVTVDDLGHESDVHSNVVHFTVDTVAPAMPGVTSPVNGASVASATPTLTFSSEPGAFVHVLIDDVGEEVSGTADSHGTVTLALTQALANGAHTLHVFARDAAGNYGDVRDSAFTVAGPSASTPGPSTTPPASTPPAATTPAPPLVSPVAKLSGVTVSSHTLTSKRPVKVRFKVSRPTTVTVTLTKGTAKKAAKPARTSTVKVTKAGTVTVSVAKKRLPKGNYILQLRAKQAAKPISVPLKVS